MWQYFEGGEASIPWTYGEPDGYYFAFLDYNIAVWDWDISFGTNWEANLLCETAASGKYGVTYLCGTLNIS